MNRIRVSRTVLRLHGSFLILLTGFLITVSLIGTFRGVGVMAVLYTYPLVEGGLFQAYGLMMLIGIVLWIGSFQENPGKWHVVGFLAHLSPLLANFIFADLLVPVETERVRCRHELDVGAAELTIGAWIVRIPRELLGDDIGGVAVHIGARVEARAMPGEVLVSSTVKDLVVGSELQFEDRGTHALKGIPDEWHLFAVAN